MKQAIVAAGGDARVAADNLGITYSSLRNTCYDHGVSITEVQKAVVGLTPHTEFPPEPTPARPVDGKAAVRVAIAPDPAPTERKRKLETELRWIKSRRAELGELWNRRPLNTDRRDRTADRPDGERDPDGGVTIRIAEAPGRQRRCY